MDLVTQKLILRCLKILSSKYMYYKPVVDRVRIKELPPEECPTMAMTNNLVILYNPEFVNTLIDKTAEKHGMPDESVYRQVVGVLLHEMLHYLFKHHWRELRSLRYGQVSHEAHNIAMDIEINQYIDRNDLPKQGCFVEEFKDIDGNPFPKGLSYEQYLELLIKNYQDKSKSTGSSKKEKDGKDQKENENSGGKGNGDKEKRPFPSKKSRPDIVTDKEAEEDVKNQSKDSQSKIEEAAIDDLIRECNETAKQRGLQALLNTQLTKVEKRKYKWEDVFKSLFLKKSSEMKFGFNARTYEKTNRRMSALGTGIIFPANVDFIHKMNLVIGVDISGSMDGVTDKMYGIIKSIFDMQDLEINLTILECDTQIERVIENFKDVTESSEIEVGQGGGTDMGAINVYIDQQKMNPDMIVIMTDNETGWNPVKFREKTVVLTTALSDTCPYKQYWVQFPEDSDI